MKLLRTFSFLLVLFITVTVVTVLVAYSIVSDSQPQLTAFDKASLDDIQRIKALLVDANTPAIDSQFKKLALTERDINIGMGYLGPATFPIPKSTYAKVHLLHQSGRIDITVPLSYLFSLAYRQASEQWRPWVSRAETFGKDDWLNISATLAATNGALTLENIAIGKLILDQETSQKILDYGLAEARKHPRAKDVDLLWNNVKSLAIDQQQLTIEYQLPEQNQSALASYQALILSEDEQALIQVYTEQLANLPDRGSLIQILKPLFAFAKDRSSQTGNPVAENRALLLAMAKAFGGDQLASLIDAQASARNVRLHSPYTIYGRRDLAQHLILSAGLTLIADEGLAGLIGIDKELADMTGGKNVSAWDLLADRTGVRLAQQATRSTASAQQLQRDFADINRDAELLPDLGPDFAPALDRFTPDDVHDLGLLAELSLDELAIFQK